MDRLTERLQVRVTPALMQAAEEEARRLKLRPADIWRIALATGLQHIREGNPAEGDKVTA